jgi:hypothetical protein
MKGTCLLALALVAAIGWAHPAPDERAVAFPEGYRRWTHVKSTLVGREHPSFPRNGGYHHFYANDKAMEGYETGTFPDGSVLVDDGLEAIDKGGLMVEGPRQRVAVMVKDSTRFRDSGNWGFESFPRDTREPGLATDDKAACLTCHQQAGPGLVFSKFRK